MDQARQFSEIVFDYSKRVDQGGIETLYWITWWLSPWNPLQFEPRFSFVRTKIPNFGPWILEFAKSNNVWNVATDWKPCRLEPVDILTTRQTRMIPNGIKIHRMTSNLTSHDVLFGMSTYGIVLKTRTGGNLSVWSNFFSGCFGGNDHFHSFSPSSFFTLLAQVLPRVHTDSGKVTDGQGVAVSQTCRRCTAFNEALPANAVSHLIWHMLSVEHMIDINGFKIFLMISNNNILSHGLVMLS